MSEHYALGVQVYSHTLQSGVRVDHPKLREYAWNAMKSGKNNEYVVTITGLPVSVVSNIRSKFEKEKRKGR